MKNYLWSKTLLLIFLCFFLTPIALAEGVGPGSRSQQSANDLASAAVKEKTENSKIVVIGNSDTKRYHLPGMRFYNKVKKYHRVYFNSEQEAIDSGYYKAGTGKDLKGTLTREENPPEKQITSDEAPEAPSMIPEEQVSQPQQNEMPEQPRSIEAKKPETPASVEKLPETSHEKKEEKSPPPQSAVLPQHPVEKTVEQPPASAGIANPVVENKIRNDQKNDTAAAQEGVILKRGENTLELDNIGQTDKKPMRIEASYSFDYLDPNATYGNWNSGQISFYHTVSPDFTYFIQGGGYNRQEGSGATGTLGVYKGWTPFLYTFTSLSAGTKTDYLPEFRVDQDFNFTVWREKNLNFVTGVSYIDYLDDHSGWIVSGGPMMTFNKWLLHYRLFYNISNPGSVSSFSHLVSLGYGQEGAQWTYLNISFGKQAYLATYVIPQEVNQNSFSVNLRHRHWLDKYYGVFGDISYTRLEDGYDRYGMGFGAFYAF